MKDQQKLSRAEMKEVLGGGIISHPCSYYLCNIDGSRGVCPGTCTCGTLTLSGLPPNETEYIPCINPNS